MAATEEKGSTEATVDVGGQTGSESVVEATKDSKRPVEQVAQPSQAMLEAHQGMYVCIMCTKLVLI